MLAIASLCPWLSLVLFYLLLACVVSSKVQFSQAICKVVHFLHPAVYPYSHHICKFTALMTFLANMSMVNIQALSNWHFNRVVAMLYWMFLGHSALALGCLGQ